MEAEGWGKEWLAGGGLGSNWQPSARVEDQVVAAAAIDTDETVLQAVCLKWVYEQGVSVLVKSFSEERMKENLHIFDWELSAQDSEMINQISQYKGCAGVEFISDEGPSKSLQDLWDGEIV
ncbi:unnamed protein product [Camellia sinensis]